MKLAKFLIEMDTSWESTSPVQYNIRPKIHRYGASPTVLAIEKEIMNQGKGERNDAEIPLFLAVKAGCRERVEEIFKTYPQAVGQIDDSGRTVIHVAIKYRQQKSFEFVVKEMEAVMPFLVRKMDNNGNNILHMVGIKKPDYAPEKMEGPALLLQEELLWFEQVKNVIISIPQFLDHQNNMGLTAEALFAATNKDLLPGGPNQNTGFPVLMNPRKVGKELCYTLSPLFRKTKQLIPECFLALLMKLYAIFCCTTPSASHSIP
ncbi:hypothetical protein Patl1_30694 [Pistacia atlantica]|uniref:Uncharacterized protein n=1 Tax=Pistacia atlantica TaxID=434234 RepID=A0ACC1AF37_9ROSI|nr:hypothetical protein Patl1_30694 [Pistacia atlantica]